MNAIEIPDSVLGIEQARLLGFGFFEATILELDLTSDGACACYNLHNLVSWFCEFMRQIFCMDVWAIG